MPQYSFSLSPEDWEGMLQRLGLPPDASDEEIDARLRELLVPPSRNGKSRWPSIART
jgi:hypothetical protein